MSKKHGFTLIELLITISIIAIVSAIGLVSYSEFNKRARDAKRQSDLRFIQSALEEYHADQKYYPVSDSIVQNQPLDDKTGAIPSEAPATKIYLSRVPQDPNPASPYTYKGFKRDGSQCLSGDVGSCTRYCLFAKLEGNLPPSDASCTSYPSGYNFGFSKP